MLKKNCILFMLFFLMIDCVYAGEDQNVDVGFGITRGPVSNCDAVTISIVSGLNFGAKFEFPDILEVGQSYTWNSNNAMTLTVNL